jgi:hypothetical protein
VQLDRIKAGIVTYGWKPSLTWGQFHGIEPAPTGTTLRLTCRRRLKWEETHNIAVSAFSATTATVVLCEPCAPVGIVVPQGFVFSESTVMKPSIKVHSQDRLESAHSESRGTASAILEMRPAHRSLKDKAREEMSDFDRDYPW